MIRLLDDIQRFDFKTLKWEHIATLANPIAAWLDETIFHLKIDLLSLSIFSGMTLDDNRIYLVLV